MIPKIKNGRNLGSDTGFRDLLVARKSLYQCPQTIFDIAKVDVND